MHPSCVKLCFIQFNQLTNCFAKQFIHRTRFGFTNNLLVKHLWNERAISFEGKTGQD
jgi:hypothetical protein